MNTQYILWLDDLRDPKDFISGYDSRFVTWIKDHDSFVEYISSGAMPDVVDFDHDLGEGKDGYDCAKFLVSWCIEHEVRLPIIRIHSANPVGRANIESLVNTYWKVHGKK